MDFKINEFTTIKKFVFSDDQIYEFLKFGEYQPYRKFNGKIENKKVTGFVCLRDDQIYNLQYL